MTDHYRIISTLNYPASVVLLLLCLSSNFLSAQYSESSDGELSRIYTAPTIIPVSLGSNTISGSTVNADRDIFSITVPPGQVIRNVNLAFKTGNRSFLGFASGNQLTADPTASSQAVLEASLLGYTHLDLPIGDQLPIMMGSSGAQGYTIPLPAGDYTFWVQETGGTTARYALDVVLEPAPAAAPIPTMNDWGITILSLLLLISFVITIKQKINTSVSL